MHLRTLELSGFKSFAKKTSLDFTSSISAIVGPNGSGKSNITEAFRFVLGEQSIKSLRGKRGEDLIFNGGKAIPRMNRGAVKIIFNNKKRILDIDFDEVTIERVVNRDGTNEYKINGSDVRLKDIVELLSSAHIGSSSHHIISQGEADRMLNASLHERKDILEEALGLKGYQYKKEEGQRKLEKTELNMKETEGLLREIAPHLRFLKKQYEKIEKAEGIRKELLDIGRIYFRAETNYIETKEREITKVRGQVTERLNQLKSRREKLRGHFNKEDQPSSDIHQLENQLKEILAEKDKMSREIGKIEGEISYIVRAIKKFEEDEETIQEIKVSLKDVENLRDDVGKIQSLEEARKLLDHFISKYKNEKNVHQELVSLKNELADLEKSKNDHLADLAGVKKKEDEMTTRIADERKRDEDRQQRSFQAEKESMMIESELHEKEEEVKRLGSEEALFIEQKAILKNDLEEAVALLGRDILSFENLDVSPKLDDRTVQHERKRTVERLKIRMEEAGISNAPEVLKEYKETEERDAFLRKELSDLDRAKNSLLEMIGELEEKINAEFKVGIKKINSEFHELFRVMFGGGEARLEVVREKIRRRKLDNEEVEEETEDEPAFASEEEASAGEEGIDILVELPHKKTKGLVMLSGGERALTSIALLFAMSQVNPPPFIILDETDAALDEANSRKYGDMIEKLSKHSELILITHNRETMSRAGVIYGVTMAAEGTSKLLSIKFDEAVVIAK